jgi:hypothetical protein
MKFDFRVGICLAVLAISAACSKSPEAPTAPSATQGAPSAATGPGGSTLKFNAPALVAPVEGAKAEDRRPTLLWANATAKYAGIGVAYDLEVETATAKVYSQTVGETPDFGQHLLPFDTEFDTKYFWRVRSRVGNEFGPWANWAEFMSTSRPVSVPSGPGAGPAACAAPLSPLGAGETRKPRPNHSAVVRQMVSAFPHTLAQSCQESGGSWEFMDRAVDALRSVDGRYGYNCKRGNCGDPSLDVVSYYWAGGTDFQGSTQVYIFDLLAGHCGPTPSLFWGDVTDITFSSGTVGKTMYPRPGRNVTPTTCAAAGQ